MNSDVQLIAVAIWLGAVAIAVSIIGSAHALIAYLKSRNDKVLR